jgi:predicted flap endonuclease-1-like 5' DNA nuclease
MRWRRFLVGALIGFLIIYWLRQWVRMAPEAAPGLRIKGVRVDLDTCCARVMGRKLKTVRLTAGPSARANDVSLDVEADASPERAPGSTIVLTPAVELPREPDDLTRLEGIGPKIRDLLAENGIATFAQLAASSMEQLRSILNGAGARFRIADPRTWPDQALLARNGDWEALKAFQGTLKGGRLA